MKLKPCPFCGSKDIELYKRHTLSIVGHITRYSIQCNSCYIGTSEVDEGESEDVRFDTSVDYLVSVWNRRKK